MKRVIMTQPAAWLQAFRKQAKRDGYALRGRANLSEWLGACGLECLDADLQAGLPERPKPHRPSKQDN